uniref:Uncharacterized LOC104266199 n=1 Tax=Ciona intestinalis TaxID=7719 RepID=H2XRR9_CIOIN
MNQRILLLLLLLLNFDWSCSSKGRSLKKIRQFWRKFYKPFRGNENIQRNFLNMERESIEEMMADEIFRNFE